MFLWNLWKCVLVRKGIIKWNQKVQISTGLRGRVETYSSDDPANDCVLDNYNVCQSYGLSETEFIPESIVSSDSNSDNDTGSGVTIKFYHWYKSESGDLSKIQMTLDMSDSLDKYKKVMKNVKRRFLIRDNNT